MVHGPSVENKPGSSPVADPSDQIAALRELTRTLHAAGKDPLAIYFHLNQVNCRAGSPVPRVSDLIRALPGLDGWDVWEALAESWRAPPRHLPPAENPAPRTYLPNVEEARQIRRGQRLAALVVDHKDQLGPALVEAIGDGFDDRIRDVLAIDLPEALEALRDDREGRS